MKIAQVRDTPLARELRRIAEHGSDVAIEEAGQVVRRWLRAEPHAEAHAYRGIEFRIIRQDGEDAGDVERRAEGTASVDGFLGDGILLDPAGWPEALRERADFPIIQSGHRLEPEHTVGGSTSEVWHDGVGLDIQFTFSKAADVDSLWMKAREGYVRGLSVAFWLLDGAWDQAVEAFRATRFLIPEISVVPLPRDRGATFSLTRSWGSPRQVREILSTPELRLAAFSGCAIGFEEEHDEHDEHDEPIREEPERIEYREHGHAFEEAAMTAAIVGAASLTRVGLAVQAGRAATRLGR